MMNQIVHVVAKYRHRSFIRVARRTLALIFPFALLGAITRMLLTTAFSPDGYLYNILNTADWLPRAVRFFMRNALMGLSQVTLEILAVYAAFGAAKYTAKLYHADDQLAGITGAAAVLLLAVRYSRLGSGGTVSYDLRLLGYGNLFFALVIGYLIGQLFRGLGHHQAKGDGHVIDIQERVSAAARPIMVTMGLALALNAVLNLVSYYALSARGYGLLQSLSSGNAPFWRKLLMACLTTILEWLGLTGPYNLQLGADPTGTAANLNYALAHHSLSGVPYPFLGSTLYNSFATFGGAGLSLALVIAIMLGARHHNYHRMVRANFFPVLFNSNAGLMVGLPVILNPLYLVPAVFLPLINIVLAAGAIFFRLIPTPVYWVPDGTPGPLVAFVGTNGSWTALLFSLLLLMFDVWAYLPFVGLSLAVEERIMAIDQGGEQHEPV